MVVIRPTVDTLHGDTWWCAPGDVRLRCECGSDDLLSIAPGGEGDELMGMTVTRGIAMRAFCEACWLAKHR